MGSKPKGSGRGSGDASNSRGKVLQQDYSSFKTPEATQAALNRQKKILDRNRTSTGAFANQADALNKAGYTLNDTRDKVMSPTGATIAGINKNNQLFSGNQEVSDILKKDLFKNSRPTKPSPSFSPESTRQDDRVANTFNVLDQIYDLDEMSKFGEEKVNRVFDAGRGVKFANNPNPADPFRLTASTPTAPQLKFPLSESTMGEAFGDMRRALFGGTAPQTIPGLSIANQPRNQEGILNAYKRIPTPTNLLMKMFGEEEEESPAGGPGGLGLAGIRNFYEDNPYSVPTGRALPLDYLQGGFNRLDDEEEEQERLIEDVLASNNMNNQGFTPEGFDFPIQEPIVETPYIPSGASAGAPQDTGFDISEILKNKIIIDPSKGSRGSENQNNNGGGGSEGEGEEVVSPPSGFTESQLLLIANLMSAGYSREEAESRARSYEFAYGGSVAPQSGPMSNGIGTLYNTR